MTIMNKIILIIALMLGMFVSSFGQTQESIPADSLSVEKLYERLKKEKDNDSLVRLFLTKVPEFLSQLQGNEYEKWSFRLERVYKDYAKRKQPADWMNPADFPILQMFHTEADGPNDPYLDYIMSHYEQTIAAVGQDPVFQFVLATHLGLIDRQARAGDTNYRQNLQRVQGDMKQVYDSLMNFNGKDIYTGMKLLYDGYYNLYGKKNIDMYFDFMDKYADYLGNAITATDYLSMVETLHAAVGSSKDPKVLNKYVEWLTAALQNKIGPEDKLDALLMLGDCYKRLKNIDSAKKCYNQAYMHSLQFGNPGLSTSVQQYLKDLETL